MPPSQTIELVRALSDGRVTANDFHKVRVIWLTEAGLFHPDSLPVPVKPVTETVDSQISPVPETADA